MAILKDLIVLGASRITDALYAKTIYENGTALSSKYAAINHNHDDTYLKTQDHYKTSLTAQTTQAVYPITINANGHIASYGTAVTIKKWYCNKYCCFKWWRSIYFRKSNYIFRNNYNRSYKCCDNCTINTRIISYKN